MKKWQQTIVINKKLGQKNMKLEMKSKEMFNLNRASVFKFGINKLIK